MTALENVTTDAKQAFINTISRYETNGKDLKKAIAECDDDFDDENSFDEFEKLIAFYITNKITPRVIVKNGGCYKTIVSVYEA